MELRLERVEVLSLDPWLVIVWVTYWGCALEYSLAVKLLGYLMAVKLEYSLVILLVILLGFV